MSAPAAQKRQTPASRGGSGGLTWILRSVRSEVLLIAVGILAVPPPSVHAQLEVGTEMKARNPAPAFQVYARDVLLDSTLESLTDRAFRWFYRLACHEWVSAGLPQDPAALARLCHVTESQFLEEWPSLRPHFRRKRGLLVIPALEAQRRTMTVRRAASADAGKRGAERRWGRVANGENIAKDGSSSSSSKKTPTESSVVTAPRHDEKPDKPPARDRSLIVDLPLEKLAKLQGGQLLGEWFRFRYFTAYEDMPSEGKGFWVSFAKKAKEHGVRSGVRKIDQWFDEPPPWKLREGLRDWKRLIAHWDEVGTPAGDEDKDDEERFLARWERHERMTQARSLLMERIQCQSPGATQIRLGDSSSGFSPKRNGSLPQPSKNSENS